MPATRVDFKHVRENADFAAVLNAYGIELSKDGTKEGQYKALCPFHDDTKPSLKINTSKNIFNCFPCEAGGNILEFVMRMDGIDLRPAAIKVAEICGIAPAPGGAVRKSKMARPEQEPAEAVTEKPREAVNEGAKNPPLTFELKLTKPPALLAWLESRGIDEETVDAWALGQASARSKTIANRLAIPIHDDQGRLVAYCGRYIGDDVPEDVPKYILPKGFRKELEVFNLHRVSAGETNGAIVIVESYLSVIRHGHPTPTPRR